MWLFKYCSKTCTQCFTTIHVSETNESNYEVNVFQQNKNTPKYTVPSSFKRSLYRGLPRGLSDKRHCVKMWRQFVSKVPTADRSWNERSDNLRKRQSIFHFDKATTALFFFDGDLAVMTWQGQRDSFGALLFAFMVDQLYKY